MTGIAQALGNLLTALGATDDDPAMAELFAVFTECSETFDAAGAAFARGDAAEGRRLGAIANELAAKQRALSAAYKLRCERSSVSVQ
jgi:hypothetical protein